MITMRSLPPGAMGPAPHRSRPPRPKVRHRRFLLVRAVARNAVSLAARLRGRRPAPALAPTAVPGPDPVVPTAPAEA